MKIEITFNSGAVCAIHSVGILDFCTAIRIYEKKYGEEPDTPEMVFEAITEHNGRMMVVK